MVPLDNSTASSARSVPADLAVELDRMGKNLGEELIGATRELYLPKLEALTWPDIKVIKDLSYGPDAERHLLDVHVPEGGGDGMATVIFFHGGGFVRGHKNSHGDLISGNVANFFARSGIIGVNATYRLAPDVQWPEGARDVGAALAWARENIAEYGGDPEKIFLFGQSAGATHVATYAFRTQLHPESGPGCAGVILLSGVYNFEKSGLAANRIAYYGEDESQLGDMVVIGNVERADFPVFIGVAEYDTFNFEKVASELSTELIHKHQCVPRFKQMLGHNHVSYIFGLGTEDQSIGPDLLDFVNCES